METRLFVLAIGSLYGNCRRVRETLMLPGDERTKKTVGARTASLPKGLGSSGTTWQIVAPLSGTDFFIVGATCRLP